MKAVFISDTHNMHSKISMPSGDVCIHSGDATGRGLEHEIKNFIEWYSKQKFEHKIYVPGNHDVGLEHNYEEWSKWFTDAGITLLNDESVTIDGIKIHGSPITPNFGHGWAWNRARGETINKHWMMIPKDTDILVTHGPPMYVLDQILNFAFNSVTNVGCEMLAAIVNEIAPMIHAFGHIHEGAGFISDSIKGIEYINASQLDEAYRLVHAPIVREINKSPSK